MARENTKRKPAVRTVRRRDRYVPSPEPLSRKWVEVERARSISQKELASIMGCTEGYVSQLLAGRTKLTLETALHFASYLRIAPADIWADFPFPNLYPGSLTPDAVEVARNWRAIPDESTRASSASLIAKLSHRS